MPLIEPIVLSCPTFKVGARSFEICMPGGACISAQMPELFTVDAEICRSLLGNLMTTMAPMAPIFNIIGAVLCVKDLLVAVPEIVTNPAKFGETLDRCLPTIAALVDLLPQVAAPKMIADSLDLIICIINSAITDLQLVIQKAVELENLTALSTGPQDPLFGIIECATTINGMRMCAINESLGPLNGIIGILNLFGPLVGLDEIPTISELGADATNAIDKLRVILKPLRQIRAALRIPSAIALPRC